MASSSSIPVRAKDMIAPLLRRPSHTLGMGLLLVALGGCASSPATVPPLSPRPSGDHQVGQFVWYDLLTNDLDGAKRFYGGLFGWTFDDGGEDEPVYTTIRHGGRAIGGIAYIPRMKAQVNASQWVSNLSVEDVDRAAAYVANNGGSVEAEPQELPHRGRVAVVRDNQGALVAIVRSQSGDPVEDRAMDGGWLWTELWTRDADSSIRFYEGLVGYEHRELEDRAPGTYYLFEKDGEVQAGVLAYDFEQVEPNWLPYIRVDDPADLVRRVEELGGRVLIAPNPEIRGGTAAVIADPSGAAVTIQQWPQRG